MSTIDFSENEDDPDVYESSGSEWNSSEQEVKRKSTRKVSTRSKKARTKTESTSSDSDLEDSKPRKRNGVNKKQKVAHNSTNTSPSKPAAQLINAKDYSTGSFLILKKDAQVGDPNKPPCIWRVDGKALLQKYEPFDENGKIRHKTTSVYTGWSALDRDLYAPIAVTVQHKSNQQLIVDVNWENLKLINMDSD